MAEKNGAIFLRKENGKTALSLLRRQGRFAKKNAPLPAERALAEDAKMCVCVPNAQYKTPQNEAELASYPRFSYRQKPYFTPLNLPTTYPFTYPFCLASDIFHLQFHCVISRKNIFVKTKKYFQKKMSRGPPVPSGDGAGLFLRPPKTAKHPRMSPKRGGHGLTSLPLRSQPHKKDFY
jgi:hypothetical protein